MNQLTLFRQEEEKLISLKEAGKWASQYLNRNITVALYANGIADVLKNCKKYLQKDYDVFLVANDKYNLYPEIAMLADMKIVNQFKRPVLNRVEKERSAYAEIIFHLNGI